MHIYIHTLIMYTYINTYTFVRIILIFAALGINFARQGFARQSSWGNAERAIDGKADGIFKHKSCTITNKDYSPWWTVYFKKIISVREVIIHNRNDCCGK